MKQPSAADMAPLLFAYCLVFLLPFSTYSLKIDSEPINSNSTNITSSTKISNLSLALSQSAPYNTIFDKNIAPAEQNKTVLRNVLIRLTNGTIQLKHPGLSNGAADADSDSDGEHDDHKDDTRGPTWMLIGPNGTIVGHKLNLNIEKLLDNLRSNNFTSELRTDRQDPTRIINITISDKDTSPLDEFLLEELIMAAAPSGANHMPIIRDNHRFVEPTTTHKTNTTTLLRPKPPQQASNQVSVMITPPPIRAIVDVVAENYTIRKVSEEANVFGLKLLHQVNIEKLGSRNVVQTPFAVYQGLGLLMTGAMGDTAKELDKVLLGAQSTYENQKFTHDQDRNRLLASFSDTLRQLHSSATDHLRNWPALEDPQLIATTTTTTADQSEIQAANNYGGGTLDQHLILANNLLFSPSAYEISPEFKQYLANYYNQTALTKIEVGSTESIQTINGWIRKQTGGLVPTIIDKRNTFDETNVMSLLSTSWLQQQWRDNFYRVTSPNRSGIRLKLGHIGRAAAASFQTIADDRANLLEFVDDNKQSHFVEYIKSEPSKNIHVYRTNLGNNQPVELVTVPFRDSYHRLITITPNPVAAQSASMNGRLSLLQQQQQLLQTTTTDGSPTPVETLPDSSSLSKLIAHMSNNPHKVMRSIWNIVAPDIITKQTLQSIQQARQKNITIDEQLVGANVIPHIQLSMPILRSGSDSSLSAALNHMGVVNTFDPYQANFIGINGHPFNYYKLHLSNVIFKTTFNLNERGINYDRTIRTLESMRIHSATSQADRNQSDNDDSTSTAFKLEFIDYVKLNKPFVYMICDMRTKLILYTGTLRDPTQ